MRYRLAEISLARDACEMFESTANMTALIEAGKALVRRRISSVVRISRLNKDGTITPVRRIEWVRGVVRIERLHK
jgi:hypothetical protein